MELDKCSNTWRTFYPSLNKENNSMTDTTLFGETPPVTETKYDTWDVEALRKKAEAADNHIRTLEEEARNYRATQTTNATLEEVLKKLDTVNQPPAVYTPPVVNNPPVVNISQSEHISKQDVLNILEQKQKELQAKANVDSVKQELQKVWGDDFSLKLKEKSKQLSVPQDFLASMAESHPSAFLKLVTEGNANTNPNVHVPPASTIRTKEGIQPFAGEKMKDFQKAMKENPHLRSDAEFQKRMMLTAERQGASFFE